MGNVDGTQVILHSFYKKNVASPYKILKRSALSYSVKKSILLQEAMRRLGNISHQLPWHESVETMDRYSNMLRISGYNHWERYNFIKGSLSRHYMMYKLEKGGLYSGAGSRSRRPRTSKGCCQQRASTLVDM